MSTPSPLRGALLMVAFCIMAPLLDACSKLATEAIPVGQITAARFLFQGLCMLPVFALMRPKWGGTRRDLFFITARAFCLILSTYCFVASVQFMPIADAIAIVFVMPFMIMGLSRLIFGTPIGKQQVLASLVGFGGALLVIQPKLSTYGLVALFPLGCALAFSFYEFATQAMSTRVDAVSMQLHTSLAGFAMAAPVLWAFDGSGVTPLDPVMPDAINTLWLFGVGFWAAASHFCMTVAMRHAPAATLAPLHYLELPMAVFLGYAIFGDFPNAYTWIGMAVIVGSGLYVIRLETRGQPPLLPDEAI
ncbi:DMT family transporter [Stagnihabitans tardus]|uniref:EamA family transporter n=1 Tax=Stagnihabitans tardus TaxID=2699202 RepID=A0AAE5BWM0_9RHOB|nr:DMT family transporter [Stagnihabitans tardus]NBZ89452.1 EamA family transporter [Stagnihabitans tardus]